MAKIKLLLLALLFMAIPKGLYAYTTGQIVTFNHMTYKVTSSTLRTLIRQNEMYRFGKTKCDYFV